jgi:hypothetical protein
VKRGSVKNSSDGTNVGNDVIVWVLDGISAFGVFLWGGGGATESESGKSRSFQYGRSQLE